MKITKLNLSNYRNYENESISFSDNLNVIIGKNAQGKTNLLEAIFLSAIGKSPRTTKDKDLINWNKKFAKISISTTKKIGSHDIDIYLFHNQNKAIKIDKIPIKKISQLLGTLNAIYFSPDELKLIKESPEERRKFMDIDLCQFDKNYYYNLSNYNKTLNQRNKLLKSENPSVIRETLPIWDIELAKSGSKIIMSRLQLIEKLKIFAKDIHFNLTNNQEELKLSYQGITGENTEEIEKILISKLSENIEKDIKLGFTTVGPHRDDIKISSNDIDLRSFGSQGQQRTASLSLKLAELSVFKENLGEYPILLLDDVLSELDENRQNKLLSFVSNIQTIITCTDFNFSIPHTKYYINNGKLEKVEKFS